MLIKAGVDISRLRPLIRKSLARVEGVFVNYSSELIITSTYEGNHGAGSLHYANDAYDIRFPMGDKQIIVAEIKRRLSTNFDVIQEDDHIHIEYDPKT